MPKEIVFKPTLKQEETLNYLRDDTTRQILFGGGAGGGKSHLGVSWLVISCLTYPKTRWLMGRSVLKSLKETTLNSFFDVCADWGLKKDVHWKLNSIDGVIKFTNGSEILLKDLAMYPSDPEFDSLGSLEISGAFIDECNQITKKARDIVFSRIRYKLKDFCGKCGAMHMAEKSVACAYNEDIATKWKCYNCGGEQGGLTQKLLMTCNPAKNWTYSDFYLPDRKGELEDYKKFVPALVKDNKYMTSVYAEGLETLDEASKQRLLYGNWDYDDDPYALFDREKLEIMFTQKVKHGSSNWITVDVARKGADRTVYGIWEGYHLKKIIAQPRTLVNEVVDDLMRLEKEYSVARGNIIIDEDGVGGGVVDNLRGCVGFVNNGRPDKVNNEVPNFANRKTQCVYKLSEFIEAGKISVADTEYKDIIIEELQQIKQVDVDKDGKLKITPKDVIKEAIGRSPDFADMMMMRMVSRIIIEKRDGSDIVGQVNRMIRSQAVNPAYQ